jgi:peroxiredoxin
VNHRWSTTGYTLLRRLTMVVTAGRIEMVIYPVFPPDRAADDVLDRLRDSTQQ